MPFLRSDWRSLAGNLAEGCVRHAGVRVSVAGNVQSVEGIEPETEGLLPEDNEVLECRHVNVQVSRTACAAIGRCAEGVAGGHAEGASNAECVDPGAWLRAWRRGGIRAVPVVDAVANDFQRQVLIGTRLTVGVGVGVVR